MHERGGRAGGRRADGRIAPFAPGPQPGAMSPETLLPLLAIIALASYFQTVTGFGLGMIVMGATSGFGLASLASVAAVVSLVTLANSAVALPGKLHHIDWRAAGAASIGILPAIVIGLVLLEYLSASASHLLQLLLGLVILHGSASFAFRPVQLARRSSDRGFLASGFFSGLSGGLFGVAGPPLIFQFYRQPMAPVAVRNTLLLLFAETAGARALFLGMEGRLDAEIWTLTAFTVPLVALATLIGRRYPPLLPSRAMRRAVFAVLILIGGYLVVESLPALLAAFGVI